MGAPPPRLSPAQADRAERLAALMSPAAMTRAMETLGVSLVEMRQAPDPRVDLEVALVRLCRPDADRSLDALSARVEQLERQLAGDAPTTPIAAPRGCAAGSVGAEPVPTSPPRRLRLPPVARASRQPLAGRSRRSVATRHRRHRLRRPRPRPRRRPFPAAQCLLRHQSRHLRRRLPARSLTNQLPPPTLR